jgi:hypothetical protein
MALINFYKHTGGTELVKSESPKAKTHAFTMTLTDLVKNERNISEPNTDYTINGIINELPELTYSTSWDIGPISVISSKIESFATNKYFRMLAGNNSEYRPPLLTDGWTQQMPKSGSPVSFNIEFRSFPKDGYYNTSSYYKILEFLFFATTPNEYNISDTIAVAMTALDFAQSAGNSIGKAINEATDVIKSAEINWAEIASAYKDAVINPNTGAMTGNASAVSRDSQKVVSALNNLTKALDQISNMINPDVGGAPLCNFTLGNYIKYNHKIKWLIKNWSFKPAINVTYNEETKEYPPIYIDFKVGLESQMVFTADEMHNIVGY